MGSSKLSTWIAGTVIAAMAIAAGGWFLLVSPVLAAAAETREATVSAEESNAMLQTKIARLAKQFAELDVYKGELAALRTQVPTDAELASYLRQIEAVAVAHSVTITAVMPGAGVDFVLDPTTVAVASAGEIGAVVEAVPAPAEDPDGGVEAGQTDPGAPEPAGPTAPAGLVAVPISITAMGAYDNVIAFLADLQGGTDRLLLVTTVSGSRLDDAVAAGGRPGSTLGDLEVDIAAMLYVLPESTPEVIETEPPAVPAPIPGKNPLVPLG